MPMILIKVVVFEPKVYIYVKYLGTERKANRGMELLQQTWSIVRRRRTETASALDQAAVGLDGVTPDLERHSPTASCYSQGDEVSRRVLLQCRKTSKLLLNSLKYHEYLHVKVMQEKKSECDLSIRNLYRIKNNFNVMPATKPGFSSRKMYF